MKIEHIRYLFFGVVIAILIVSLVMYRNLDNYIEEVTLIRNSNVIMRQTETILSSIKDAETGHRGFQLTRDTIYLDPYNQAVSVLPQQLKVLDSLVSNNEVQQRNVDTLFSLIRDQFLIIANILANAKRTTLYMDAYESNLLTKSRNNMDGIRRQVKNIMDEEERTIIIRSGNESSYRKVAPVTLMSYTVLALFGVTFLFSRVLQALNRREVAEKLLKDNLEHLQRQNFVIEENRVLLNQAESLAQMGSWKWTSSTNDLVWTDGLYGIFNKQKEDPISWYSFLEYVYLDDKEMLENFLKEVEKLDDARAFDCRIMKDNRIHYLFITAQPQKNSAHKEILGTVIDITERKEYEKQLQQYNRELKRSNEDLEQFASVASHDLQEPLRKIRAFGDRLSVKYPEELGEQGADYIRRMQSAAARMQALIEDLLAFSRVSRVETDFELLDPDLVFKEILEDIDVLVKSKNAKVTVGRIPQFRGNKLQIKRLFQNLISNAVKFHKPDEPPTVLIKGKLVSHVDVFNEFGVSLPGHEHVRISVQDNGIGFDVKYSEKIFNIFQRLHGRTAYEGTGIGLAICRKIVTNHNGFITANSIENVGSEFMVIIPRELITTTTYNHHELNRIN